MDLNHISALKMSTMIEIDIFHLNWGQLEFKNQLINDFKF